MTPRFEVPGSNSATVIGLFIADLGFEILMTIDDGAFCPFIEMTNVLASRMRLRDCDMALM